MKCQQLIFVSCVVLAFIAGTARSDDILYQTGFEEPDYIIGDLHNQNGWINGNTSRWHIDVTNDTPHSGDQCCRIFVAGSGGYDHPLSMGDGEIIKASGWFKFNATGTVFDVFLNTVGPSDRSPTRIVRGIGGTNLYPAIKTFDGGWVLLTNMTAELDEWVYFAYTLDYTSHKYVSVQLNQAITNFTNALMQNQSDMQAVRFFISSWGGSDDTDVNVQFDDILIERIKREAPPKLTVTPLHSVVGPDQTETMFTLANEGTGSFDYTAATVGPAAPWLSLSSGGGTVAATEPMTVTVNRTTLNDGYYRAMVKFDAGSAGCITVQVDTVSGMTLFETSFDEPWYIPGELSEQDGWARAESGYHIAVTNMPHSDGPCGLIYHSGYWDGYTHDVIIPPGAIIKMGARFYLPGDGVAGNVKLAARGWWNRTFESEIVVDYDEGMCNLVPLETDFPDLEVPPPVPTNTWFDFSFTVDLENKLLLETCLGTSVVEYTETYLPLVNIDTFQSVAIVGVSTNGVDPCYICFDDVYVEEIPEPVFTILAVIGLGVLLRSRNVSACRRTGVSASFYKD